MFYYLAQKYLINSNKLFIISLLQASLSGVGSYGDNVSENLILSNYKIQNLNECHTTCS